MSLVENCDYFDSLPDELIMMIFEYLNIEEIRPIFYTCERFARIVCDTKPLGLRGIRPLHITDSSNILYKTEKVFFDTLPNNLVVRRMLPIVFTERHILGVSLSTISNFPQLFESSHLNIALDSKPTSIPSCLDAVPKLTISNSNNIRVVRDLPNITYLELSDATNLESIDSSCPRLETLKLKGSKKLANLGHLETVTQLTLSNCRIPQTYPPNLIKLTLSDINISKLVIPSTVQKLELATCNNLTSVVFENDICGLEVVHILSCPKFSDLSTLTNVRELKITCDNLMTPKLNLSDIANFGYFKNLEILVLSGFSNLVNVDMFAKLKNLKTLKIVNCNNVTKVVGVSNLDELDIDLCQNLLVVSGISNVKNLQITTNYKLTEITELTNIGYVIAQGCPKLKSINKWFNVRKAFISMCPIIDDINGLSEVEEIYLRDEGKLQKFDPLLNREKPIKRLFMDNMNSRKNAHTQLKANLVARWGYAVRWQAANPKNLFVLSQNF